MPVEDASMPVGLGLTPVLLSAMVVLAGAGPLAVAQLK